MITEEDFATEIPRRGVWLLKMTAIEEIGERFELSTIRDCLDSILAYKDSSADSVVQGWYLQILILPSRNLRRSSFTIFLSHSAIRSPSPTLGLRYNPDNALATVLAHSLSFMYIIYVIRVLCVMLWNVSNNGKENFAKRTQHRIWNAHHLKIKTFQLLKF